MTYSRAEPSPETDASKPRLRILLIDDERMMRRSLRRLLALRHNVVTAEDGDQAVALLQTDRDFDVILCDLMMPGLDGPAVHEHLKTHFPGLVERVIFMTGGACTARARSFVSRHAPIVLEKPIAVPDLFEVLTAIAAGEPAKLLTGSD